MKGERESKGGRERRRKRKGPSSDDLVLRCRPTTNDDDERALLRLPSTHMRPHPSRTSKRLHRGPESKDVPPQAVRDVRDVRWCKEAGEGDVEEEEEGEEKRVCLFAV